MLENLDLENLMCVCKLLRPVLLRMWCEALNFVSCVKCIARSCSIFKLKILDRAQ